MTATGPRRAEAGVSMVETLVVLAVLAVAAGGALLAIGPRAPGAEAEALRLAGLLEAAADRALASAGPTEIVWAADGYVLRIGGGGETAVRLPAGLRLEGEAAPLRVDRDLAAPARLALHGAGATWDILFDGSRAAVARRER